MAGARRLHRVSRRRTALAPRLTPSPRRAQHLEVIKEQHYSSKVLWLNRPKVRGREYWASVPVSISPALFSAPHGPPQSLNALNMEMLEQFLYWVQQVRDRAATAPCRRARGSRANAAPSQYDENDAARAVFIRGRGDKVRALLARQRSRAGGGGIVAQSTRR